MSSGAYRGQGSAVTPCVCRGQGSQRCNLAMCVCGSEVCRFQRGLSRTVSWEVSSDA